MRGFRKLAAVVVMSSVGMTGVAVADVPNDPPRGSIRQRGEWLQRAPVAAQCWPGKDGAMGCSEQTPLPWPARDEIERGSRVNLRIGWKRKPQKFSIRTYKEVGKDGRPDGWGWELNGKLVPVWREGKIRAWKVRFRLYKVRHHYVKLMVDWKNVGLGVYHAHLKTVDD